MMLDSTTVRTVFVSAGKREIMQRTPGSSPQTQAKGSGNHVRSAPLSHWHHYHTTLVAIQRKTTSKVRIGM
jgi:hypothetical protein